MRASSWNQIDSRLPWRASVAAIFLSFRGALFKGRCGGLIFLRVARSPLLPRQPHAFHHAAHVADVVADTVAILDQPANVLEREGGEAFLVDVGAGEHGGFDLGFLLGVEAPRAPRSRPVVEPIEPFRVEALDGIAQRLIGHARQPRRLLALVAVELVGDGQHAHCSSAIALLARQRAKLLGSQIRCNLNRPARHGIPRINVSADFHESQPRVIRNPWSQKFCGAVSVVSNTLVIVLRLTPYSCFGRTDKAAWSGGSMHRGASISICSQLRGTSRVSPTSRS